VSLIEQLYDDKTVELIKGLYLEDPNCREKLYSAFASKILEKADVILTSSPLDILSILCMSAPFASSKEECLTVSVIVYKGLKLPNPLPYMMDDHGFLLAEKTLVALSFFNKAMEHRSKYHGAPTPDFYRQASKLLFIKNDLEDIAEHHEKWESFLGEMFV